MASADSQPGDPALDEALAPLTTEASQRLGGEVQGEALQVLTLSQWALRHALANRAWFDAFAAGGTWREPTGRAHIDAELEDVTAATTPDELKQRLRQARNRVMVRVIWRHVMRRAPLEETVGALSWLADRCIASALDVLYGWAVDRRGVPRSADGEPQRMVVFALGKLGAGELNLSSDVDLILGYPEPGQTERGTTCQQFFVRLGQQLIDALDTVTADGFVFRVDMRLRPFGASGPLVMHFAGLETYFETEGRDWERYALIKARACAGDVAEGSVLLARLRPFVYRRYLDFGAIQAMRDMHTRMLAERAGKQYRHDIKLGRGGIRDAEFVVQMQQLIWGGREPGLQDRRLMPVAAALAAAGHLEHEHVSGLLDAYRFLRDTEHAIQALDDQQTQQLPVDDDQRLRIAVSMGFPDWRAFDAALEARRETVAGIFAHYVTGADEPSDDDTLWGRPDAPAEAFATHGFEDPEAARDDLARLDAAARASAVGSEGAVRLDRLMPWLLQDIEALRYPDRALARAIPVLRAVLRRSAYLVLLVENRAARRRFVTLIHDSRWIAEHLAQHPILLDTLLNPAAVSSVPETSELRAELDERLALFRDDEEHQAEVLREFKMFHSFSVATAEVSSTLPLMRVSDYLTGVAEAVLGSTLQLAWNHTAARVEAELEASAGAQPFIMIGYGKLGGLELGHGSDLDLVFVHDLPVTASRFVQRLVRRLMHLLNIRTHLGPLYEIDMRLRPSGNSAPLATTLEAFERYQREGAWVWEHQALVRARVVAGDAELARRFAEVRTSILCQPRDRAALRAEVASMRSRLMLHHGSEEDLKQGPGGIVDIEFMVQYLVLAWAHAHPQLAFWSDNIRILEAVADTGLLPADDCRRLIDAYQGLRSEWHRRTLDIPDEAREAKVLARYRDEVRAFQEYVFGSDDV